MNLYILRHGLAVERGTPGYARDSERPLTPKGERKVWRIAEAMEALELGFDLILSSPYVRARQSAEIVAEAFKAGRKLELCDHLTPEGSARELVGYLSGHKPRPDNVLLVGHEPCLSELISLLLAGDCSVMVTLKKGGLCKLEVEALQYGRCASLAWLLTPKLMALMT
jgi:phosphohistidine phosphatase